MPSTRSVTRGIGCVAALAAFTGLAAAQTTDPAAGLGLGTRLGIRFVVGLVVNLVMAGLLVGIGPHYARECVNELHDDPGGSFGWGLLVGIGVPLVLIVLAITIVGLIVAIPGVLLLAVVGLAGGAVTIVWVGDSLTGGRGSVGGKSIAVGALALAVPTAIPVIGNLIVTILSYFGMGVVGHRLYRSWAE